MMTKKKIHGYSSESTQVDLKIPTWHGLDGFLENLCILVLWTKEALALKGLNTYLSLTDRYFCAASLAIF